MFIYINKLRSAWRNKLLTTAQDSRRGQVAVIMIVVIAIGLILFAASINLTMMSQSKTLTMKAADASASSMASFIASYGQREYVEGMGSRVSYCQSSGNWIVHLITAIVLIIIAVVAYYFQAYGIASSAATAAALELAGMAVQAYTAPRIMDMWNRMQNANLTTTGQAVENGLQAGLQATVTDSAKMPDLYDTNQDGLFGYPGNDQTKPPKDTIGRFALYNTKRFLALTGPDTTPVANFLDALHKLVVARPPAGGDDGWGMSDPVYYPDFKTHGPNAAATNPCFIPPSDIANFPRHPAECDYCCTNVDPAENVPPECDPISGVTQVGQRATCASRSAYRAPGNVYGFVYDQSYEDPTNGIMSFREQLGRDDEHHLYHVNPANPNWHARPFTELQILAGDTGFYLKDTVGFYTPQDTWVSATPRAPTLFPLLYKMQDWGPQLSSLTYNNYECHWCDGRQPVGIPGNACPFDIALYPEISAGRLVLPGDPATTVPYNTGQGWCENSTNRTGPLGVAGPNDPPILADVVPGFSVAAPGTPGLLVPDGQCAIDPTLYVSPPITDVTKYYNGWKRGADRYCSNSPGVLYSLDCPKHGGVATNPQCGQTGAAAAASWPDDMLDEIMYGMQDLFNFESILWKRKSSGLSGLAQLAKDLTNWYPPAESGKDYTGKDTIGDWIEPPCPDPTNCPGSFTKLARPGTLYVWRSELKWLNKQIQDWLVPSNGVWYNGATKFGASAAWCLPPNQVFGGISPDATKNVPLSEQATFDVNGNGVRGDVADVIACLRWNAQNSDVAGGFAATGDAAKFLRCRDHCGAATCTNVLPRSLVPDFYDPAKMPVFTEYPGDEAKFNTCLFLSPTIQACAANCKDGVIPSGFPYATLPPFVEPDISATGPLNRIYNFCHPVNPADIPGPTDFLDNACNGPTQAQVGVGTKLYCSGPNFNEGKCRCAWAGLDCLGIAGECNAYCPAPPPGSPEPPCRNYYNLVTDQITPSKGSCGDANFLLNFKPILTASAAEAVVQAAKLNKRADFLQARFDEAMALSNDKTNPLMDPGRPDGILTIAIRKLTAFLDNDTPNNFTDSPAEIFIQARINQSTVINGDLPSFVIYVWQDEDPTKTNLAGQPIWDTGNGYWHAVKVDVRIPRRCSGNCLNTDWPKIHGEAHGGFLKKPKVCYELINLEGMTKARVIRYDQDKDLRGLKLPSGAKIWEARLSNPQVAGDANTDSLRDTCATLIDEDLLTWLNTPTDDRHHIGAAFMMNKVPDATSTVAYRNCWQKVHRDLLAHGIQSQSCAKYYFVNGSGFRVKFVPCDNW